jgi:hypothetical protein
MAKQTFFEKVREWIGGVGFLIFLWSIRMRQDEYLDSVFRESVQASVETCAGHAGGSDVKEWICQTCGLPVAIDPK